MPITIRPANIKDIPQLLELIALSARGLSAGYYSPAETESAIKYVFGVDTQLITDQTYFAVEEDGMLIACGGWSKRNTLFGGDQFKTEADPMLDSAKDAARIRAFFVHPDKARKGVGQLLINACEQAAIANGFSRMEMGATLPGVPFYAKMGYTEMERIKLPLPDGEVMSIVKMGKMLKG
ncbi:GNAT family N-acetyltransferase [Mucilaginibacter sp.]|jgi:N-acetylglutamate synthase-like GNAT family acetyltransferase|uniref:GNAT family N-acetyltransferase n=1 Tax=Mucilaginibacter sp. TaxID=1882438 RepID=UPI002BFDB682|nr:GNAT family N-acetyltransferase [Mucilaginibacter sp.]HTI58220.1 GNAT family N-acetyltransferase [Mucilaginibacter sp.]